MLIIILWTIAALIPLCENMPSGCATKPGDVVTAMNGKTIQVNFAVTDWLDVSINQWLFKNHFFQKCITLPFRFFIALDPRGECDGYAECSLSVCPGA